METTESEASLESRSDPAVNTTTAIVPTAPVELGAQAPGTATPEETEKPKPNPEVDIKIVITSNTKGTMIGLQKTNCDPQFYQVKDLAGAVKGIPVFLDMAEKVWTVTPQYPKAQPAPAPAPSKPAAAKTKPATSSAPAAAKPAESKLQDAMF